MNALRLYVYRSNYGNHGYDPTNGGITSRYDEILVACDDGPVKVDPANPPENIFMLVGSSYSGSPRLVPRHIKPEDMVGPMFGGNYATTSDSRWGKMVAKHFGEAYRFTNCLPVFDRYETPEAYEILSR